MSYVKRKSRWWHLLVGKILTLMLDIRALVQVSCYPHCVMWFRGKSSSFARIELNLTFMVPSIITQFYTNDQKDATVWGNLLFHCSLIALHVSSDIIAHHYEHLRLKFVRLVEKQNAFPTVRRQIASESLQIIFDMDTLFVNPLLIPIWYTIFYINYIKLSSSTCFERHPLILRRSIMLIVHVCSLWYSHSVKVNYCFIVLGVCYHFVKKETAMYVCIALCWTISVS